MRIFIDGEWNGYGGELISLALVAEDGQSFYEVLECNNPDPWIAENVISKLGKPWITFESMQQQLEIFLCKFDSIHLIADWPEDIMWFCKVLITGPGMRLDIPPLMMQVLRVDTVSSNPHHALYDARSLRNWYVNVYMKSVMSEQ
jgi:hypothetical protein